MGKRAEFRDGVPLEAALGELAADIAQLERGEPMPERQTDLRFGDTLPPCHPARNAFHEEAVRMRTALEAMDPETYQCATRTLCLMIAFQSQYERSLAAIEDPDLAASHAENECGNLRHPELISKIAARYYTDYQET